MRVESGKWKVECGSAMVSDCAHKHPFRISPFAFRPAFTLIELLVAISIIATLSAMFLGASRAAMEHSRAARTRTTIGKLHTLIMERWADYETRRVELNQKAENDINSLADVTPQQKIIKAARRHDYQLLALRELMRLEMPDRWSNITGVAGPDSDAPIAVTALPENDPSLYLVLRELPTLTKVYRRRYNPSRITETYEEAECLYMIVMYGCGDGESRTMFTAQDIGDVDGDGAPEFLDGWGRPISFIRWPSGFVPASAYMTGDGIDDHDPFDPVRRDMYRESNDPRLSQFPFLNNLHGSAKGAYRLMPLIFSNGPDGESGVLSPRDKNVNGFPAKSDSSTYTRLDPYAAIFSDPVSGITNAMQATVGGLNGTSNEHIDNIHNHQDTTR